MENNKKYKRRLLLEKYPLSKEDMFHELTSDVHIEMDMEKFQDIIFYFIEEKNMFQHNLKNGHFYCSYDMYWSIFENEYGLNYSEIQSFTKYMVEEHFKTKELTPFAYTNERDEQVEEHFKTKELTPQSFVILVMAVVEEHFKTNELTPYSKNCFKYYRVEEHFKTKELTPHRDGGCITNRVEEHFKTKELTQPEISVIRGTMVEENFKLK